MLALAAWQFLTGLSNVVLGWPLVAAVSHTGGAAGLVVVFTWMLCELHPGRVQAGAAEPAGARRSPPGMPPAQGARG